MAFDGRSGSYVTVVPLPDMRAQAVIRTWPATGDVRPGSVWSHVLFIDFVDLGRLESLVGIRNLFRHPDEVGVAYFSTKTLLADADPAAVPSGELDPRLASRLLFAAYGDSPNTTVGCDLPEDAEAILFRMWEQQWPRLRRTFSFRTRRRPADGGGFTFALEVVERPARGGTTQVKPNPSPWSEVLFRDLEFPSRSFRQWLRTYGVDSASRMDVPALVDVLRDLDLDRKSPTVVVRRLAKGFPAPTAMRTLKLALLGPALNDVEPVAWPRDESVRLGLLLHAASSAFDFDDLGVAARLAELWTLRPHEAIYALAALSPSRLPVDQLDVLVASTAASAPIEGIAQLAHRSPELTSIVLAHRPDVLADPSIWDGDVAWQASLIDLISNAPTSTRTEVFLRLLDAGSASAAACVAATQPEVWWLGFHHVVETSKDESTQATSRVALRDILRELGPAAVGTPSVRPTAVDELVVLAEVAHLESGLWRQASPEAWVNASKEIAPPSGRRNAKGNLSDAQLCVLAISLVAASTGSSVHLRADAWRAAFVPLHQAFAESGVHGDLWEFLDRVLPPGTDWDRCERLRHGLAEEIRRDRWSTEEVDGVLDAIPDFREQILGLLEQMRKATKKNRGWLRDLIDELVR
jgi:hypothetical protein